MEGKYTIVKVLGHEVPMLFSSLIEHAAFLACFCKELIISAGFFELYSDQANHDYHFVSTWGKSTSLGVGCRLADPEIIEKFLNS